MNTLRLQNLISFIWVLYFLKALCLGYKNAELNKILLSFLSWCVNCALTDAYLLVFSGWGRFVVVRFTVGEVVDVEDTFAERD